MAVSHSQNGWPIVTPDKVTKDPILGHTFPNGFLKGDVFIAFTWLFTQLNKRVQPIDDGLPLDEWGYFVKLIEGSKTISNHASATAGDYNARLHVMGVRNTYNATQRAEIHQILNEADGIFRWGGDFTGRPDDMHFEIDASENEVRKFVVKIQGGNAEMFSAADIWNAVAWGRDTRRETAGDKLVYIDQTIETLEAQMTKMAADIAAIKAALVKE